MTSTEGRRGGLAAIVAFALVTLTRSASAQAPAQLDGPALYDAAYDRWKALPAAPYVTYDVDFVAELRGKRQERKYAVAYRARDGECLVTGIALDARDRPEKPDVTDRCFGPDFAFTFIPQRRGASGGGALGGAVPFDVPTPEPSSSDEPRRIARVNARSRPYAITVAGEENVGSARTVHLVLRPLRDPNKHILRDLWIDRATNGIACLRGEVEGGANLAHVEFTATYAEDAVSQTLQNVTGYVKAQLLLVKIGADVTFAQTSYATPASLPDWYFEKNAYRAHTAASPVPRATSPVGQSPKGS